MNISLDYDGTYTEDPEFWHEVIRLAKDRGHNIYCISFREEQHMGEVHQSLDEHLGAENIIGTSFRSKSFTAFKKLGVRIDDMPQFIEEGQL